MGKSSKNKKNKVPKITEEEYVNYLSSLKDGGQVCDEREIPPLQTRAENTEKTV
ncbi:MAG: hypothetical protein IJX91_02175 [Clostridia bacterium]|nr:hypothetical protein [Clostridia bacterium]